MGFLTVWAFSFILSIFLCVVWVFWLYLPHVWHTLQPFLTFKAPQEFGDVVFHSLVAKYNFYFFGYLMQIKNLICMYLFEFSLYSFWQLFFWSLWITVFPRLLLFFYAAKDNSLFLVTLFGVFLMQVRLAFYSVERLHFEDILGITPTIHLHK